MKKELFVVLVVLGVVSAVFSVLGPIHEVWHWLAALLSGTKATMNWDQTYIYGDVSLFIGFAGMFGEIAVLTVGVFWSMYKKWHGLAAYLHGYSLAFLLATVLILGGVIVPTDFTVMLENYSHSTVYAGFYIYIVYLSILLSSQFFIIRYHKKEIFVKKTSYMAKQCKKKLESLRNSEHIGENRYKPLTLVK